MVYASHHGLAAYPGALLHPRVQYYSDLCHSTAWKSSFNSQLASTKVITKLWQERFGEKFKLKITNLQINIQFNMAGTFSSFFNNFFEDNREAKLKGEGRLRIHSDGEGVKWDDRRLQAEPPQDCGGSILTPATSSGFARYEAHWAVSITQCAGTAWVMKASLTLIAEKAFTFYSLPIS